MQFGLNDARPNKEVISKKHGISSYDSGPSYSHSLEGACGPQGTLVQSVNLGNVLNIVDITKGQQLTEDGEGPY